MARNAAAVLDDIEYSDVTPGAENDGLSSSNENERKAQVPLSKRPESAIPYPGRPTSYLISNTPRNGAQAGD
jgi:hypothetical protein